MAQGVEVDWSPGASEHESEECGGQWVILTGFSAVLLGTILHLKAALFLSSCSHSPALSQGW